MARVRIKRNNTKSVKEDLYKKITEARLQNAIEYAKEMLEKALYNKEYTHRTYNLSDSYLWIVYNNGKLYDSGYAYNSARANKAKKEPNEGRMVLGREEAEMFIDTYQPRITRGIEIVFATAMFYSNYLENGTVRNRKYKVLTGILDDLIEDFGASRIKVNTDYYEY